MSLERIVRDVGRKIHEELYRSGVDGQVYSLVVIEELIKEGILRDREELVDSLLDCLERKPFPAASKPVEIEKPSELRKEESLVDRSKRTMWPEDKPTPSTNK